MYDDTDLPENPPVYNRGDVVWVKLSGFWWPAEVKNPEDMPEDILSQFKKPPLVIVKFFDEDSYEFIKNWAQIYPYNCDKKSDFINKGMAAFRSKAVHMSKFPKDIGTAEEKTDGNPNILSLPEFLPVKKVSYHELFSPNPNKKSPKKLSSISKKTPNKSSTEPIITHRRFLGKNDFRAFIMLQYPTKDRLYSSDEEEIKKLNEEPKEYIQCGTCSFETKRIEVMILHTKLHTKDDIQQSPTKRKPAKLKEEVPSDSESESEAVQPSKPKQRRKRQPKAKVTTTFSKILDEWDDSDADDEKKDDGESPKSDKEENEEESKADSKHEGSASPVPVKNTQEDIKNCFDFDEEEEEEEIMLPASLGRKIPRVIPEKHKPSISELLEQDKESEKVELSETGDNEKQEENAIEPKKSEDSQKEASDDKPVEDPSKNSSEPDDTIEKAFKELMEETSVPKIDDIDSKLKPEQNFHDASTIKFPDKGGTPANTSKQSKKKFITSFDAFEAGFRKLEAENHRKKTEIPENSLQVTEEKVEKQDRRKPRGREDVTSEKSLENRRSKDESKHFAVEEPKEIFDFDGEEPNIKLMQAQIEEKSEENLRSRKSRNKKHVEESRSSPKTEETLENNTSLIPENTTKGRRKSRWSTQQKRPLAQAVFDGPVTAEISIENLRNSVSQKMESRPVEVKARTSRSKKEPKEKTVVLNEEPQVQKEDLQKDDAPVENNREPEKIDEKTDTGLEIEENKSELIPEPVKTEEVHVARRGRPRKSHISKKELAPVNDEHALPIEETNSVPAKPEVEPESKVDEITDKSTLPGPETLPVDLPATESSEIVTEPQETVVEEVQELDQQLKVRRGRSKKRDSTLKSETEEAVPFETPVAVEEALIEQEIIPVEPQSTETVPTVEENVAESQESVKEVQEPEQPKVKGKRGRPRKRDSTPKSETDDTVPLEIPIAVEEVQEEVQAVSVESPSTEIVQAQQEISENVVELQEPVDVVLEAEHQKIKGKRGRSKKRESTSKPETDDTVLLETPVALEEALEKPEAVFAEPPSTEILETQQRISENIVELQEPVEVVQEAEQQKIKGKRGRRKKRDSTPKFETDDSVILETPVALEEALAETEAVPVEPPSTEIVQTQQEIAENIVELQEPVEVVQEAEQQKIKGKRGRRKKRDSTPKFETDDSVILETPVALEEALEKTEALSVDPPSTEILETQLEISENIVELQEPVEVVQEAEHHKIKGKRGRSRKRDSTPKLETDDTVLLETPVALEEAVEETKAVPFEPPSTEIVQTQQEIAENIVQLQEPVEVVQEAEQQKIKGKRGRPKKRDSTPKLETDDTPVALEEALEEIETVPVEPPSTEIIQTQQEISEKIELSEPIEVVQEAEHQKIKGKRGRPKRRDSTLKPENVDTVQFETPEVVEEALVEQETINIEPLSTEIIETQQEISEDVVEFQEPVEVVQETEEQKIRAREGRSKKRDSTSRSESEDTVPLEIPPAVNEEPVKVQNEEMKEIDTVISSEEVVKDILETPASIPELNLPQDEIVVPPELEVIEEVVHETRSEDAKESDVSSDNEGALSIVEKPEEVKPKKGRGRRRKHSLIDNQGENDVQSKSVPPKKNRWSRRASQDIKDTPVAIPEPDLPQEELVVPSEPQVVEEEVIDSKESDIVSSDNDGALSIDERPKKGRGRPRKHSHIENQEEPEVQTKIVPPKKNKWSRRSSQNKNDVYHSEETEMIGEETIENRLEKMNEERSLDELILPLKKSKRVNDMTALMEEETKKNSVESLEKAPETNNSSSEDITEEKKPEDSSSKITEANDIFKCVPPKKKKIEPIDIQETKEEDTVPQPPKKKIQKLFETAQALEKNDMLMSPLAKKKSFLFNQEEYQPEVKTSEENHTSTELLQPEAIEVEVPKTTEDHGEKSQTEEVRNEVDVDEFFNLPKKKEEQPVAEEDKSETVQKDLSEAKSEDNILIPANIPLLPEPELVPIEGTLTVMSEKDLADAQVEITPDKVISEKKPMTLGTFSMDFDQVLSPKKEELQTALKDKDPLKANAYKHKSELLDILEGNNSDSSSSESKPKPAVEQPVKKKPVLGSSMFDFEDAIPSQIVLASKATGDNVILESPKLLERLSMPGEQPKKINIQSDIKIEKKITKPVVNKSSKAVATPKPGPKIIIKAAKPSIKSGSKPIILSEQIIRPANTTSTPKAPPQGVKRQFEDVEDIETAFVIPKIARKSVEKEVIAVTPEKGHKTKATTSKSNAKAKILQQTIRTPKGEIIQPQQTSTTTNTTTIQSTQLADDTVFDINSMPIVLSDDLLTPESIQNMPVVLTEQVQAKVLPEKPATPSFIKKVVANVTPKQQIIFKTTQPGSGTPLTGKQTTKPRILSGSTSATKITRPAPAALLATGTSIDGKPTKYVFVPSSMTSTIPQGKTIKTVVRKQSAVQAKQNVQATELVGQQQPVGNKIMIVTNQHGQQHRVVLTPQQQKVLMHAQSGAKVTKTIIKGGIPKSLVDSPSSSGIISKPTVSTPSVSSSAVLNQGLLIPVSKSSKTTPVQGKKVVQKGKPQKTILIKNQLGQTVRKIQGTDDAELDRQVAEQLEAIKASARQQQANKTPEILNFTNRLAAAPKPAPRRAYMKKPEVIVKKPLPKPLEPAVPALTPITPPPKPTPAPQTVAKPSVAPEKPSETLLQAATAPNQTDVKAGKAEVGKPDRPLNQLVIQDALGNQTTITEGQILALPSETVDGQPQSYMLVTLDETGNLTPLNNEALMSLDPSLGLGGDINNVVLQVDQGQGIVAAVKPAAPTVEASASSVDKPKKAEDKPKAEPKKPAVQGSVTKVAEPVLEQVAKLPEASLTGAVSEAVQPSPEAALGGQQLIVTGDPVATQKFLESLSDGTTDLANILASAEGGSVIIQADGQQILIKTNAGAEAQALLGLPETENPEGAGNPVFASHKPNQDILAAALADTDVFQQPQSPVRTSPIKSQLSPGGGGVATPLYPPMHVGNVLETSLTLGSPIMTPLEVPSTNSKKIDDESEILNQVVPKNVDLPITITDPNISQTVAHQQQNAAGLIELALPIPENVVGANDINSPTSYGYVLPSLDEAVGMVATSQKAFGSSMPLLTEDLVTEGGSNGSIGKEPLLIEKALDSDQNTFDSLPLLQETIETTKDDVIKSGSFRSIGSMPMLTDDVVEDSTSSVESTKPSRPSPKHRERDIVNEGLCTLGGEMCSSLSEPPPDMFDLGSLMATPAPAKEEEVSSDRSSSSVPEETTTTSISSPGSSETSVGEIPIQPPIVATLNDLKRPGGDSPDEEQAEKRLKFDEDCK